MKFWLYYAATIVISAVVLFGIPTLMSARSDLTVGIAFGIVGGFIGMIGHQIYKKLTK